MRLLHPLNFLILFISLFVGQQTYAKSPELLSASITIGRDYFSIVKKTGGEGTELVYPIFKAGGDGTSLDFTGEYLRDRIQSPEVVQPGGATITHVGDNVFIVRNTGGVETKFGYPFFQVSLDGKSLEFTGEYLLRNRIQSPEGSSEVQPGGAPITHVGDNVYFVRTEYGYTVWELSPDGKSYKVTGPYFSRGRIQGHTVNPVSRNTTPYNYKFYTASVNFSPGDPRLKVLQGVWSAGDQLVPVFDPEAAARYLRDGKFVGPFVKFELLERNIVIPQTISVDEINLGAFFDKTAQQNVRLVPNMSPVEIFGDPRGFHPAVLLLTSIANFLMMSTAMDQGDAGLAAVPATLIGMTLGHHIASRPVKHILTDRSRLIGNVAYVAAVAGSSLAVGGVCRMVMSLLSNL